MAKKNISLSSLNNEWDELNKGDLPPIKKYYPTLSKEKEKYLLNETIEFIYLPKQKVYVAQTWDGNFAIGKNTTLFKDVKKSQNRWGKKIKKQDKSRLREEKKSTKRAYKNKIKERKLYQKEVRGIKRDRKKANKRKGKNMKYKTKKTLKTLALSVLGIGALVGVASGINAFAEKQDTELKTIIPIFEVGGLKDTDGKYVETDGSIYTKQAFECKGLEIELDFDNTIKYQVFYYEEDGDFISSTDVLLGNQELSVPFFATHARLEITPNWAEMGEDYAKTEDQVIKWYEVAKYSTQMEVKVNKEQEIEKQTTNLFKNYKDGYGFNVDGEGLYNEKEGKSSTDVIDISNYSKVIISGENMPFAACVYNKDGTYEMVVFDDSTFINHAWNYIVNDNTSSLVLTYDTGNTYEIIGII